MKTVGEKSSEMMDNVGNATSSAMKSVEDSIETLLPTESKLGLLNDSPEEKKEDIPSSNTKIII